MTYEEFIARAREVEALDKNLYKQLSSLYVERGTLQQLVRAILDYHDDIKTTLSNAQMIRDEDIRIAIGLQGQALGISNVLSLIHELMRQPPEENPNAQVL